MQTGQDVVFAERFIAKTTPHRTFPFVQDAVFIPRPRVAATPKKSNTVGIPPVIGIAALLAAALLGWVVFCWVRRLRL